MPRTLAAVLGCLCVAGGPAGAEIYRCEAEDGGVRYVGDAQACPSAEPHVPPDRVQHVEPGAQPAPAAPSEAGSDAAPVRLEDLFPPASVLPGRWESVNEAPEDPSKDPDLVSWGVRAKQTRHYTWYGHEGGQQAVRVCSAEIWGFASEGQARLAEQNLSYPGWRFERHGTLLVMLRGVSRRRGERAQRGVFPECVRVGERIAARIPTGAP